MAFFASLVAAVQLVFAACGILNQTVALAPRATRVSPPGFGSLFCDLGYPFMDSDRAKCGAGPQSVSRRSPFSRPTVRRQHHPRSRRCAASLPVASTSMVRTLCILAVAFAAPALAVPVLSISGATTNDHVCALVADVSTPSGVRCWGSDTAGQLGYGRSGSTANSSLIPAEAVVYDAAQVVVGEAFTCALLRASEGVQCWGDNGYGQLGSAAFGSQLTRPPSVNVLTGVASIASGASFVCAIMLATSGLRCWGDSSSGQLGNGGLNAVFSPPQVDTVVGVSSVACGATHTCVVMTATTGLRCFGSNQCVALLVAECAGALSCCWFFSSTNKLWPWCMDCCRYGELGTGVPTAAVVPSVPTADALVGVAQVVAGAQVTCIITLSSEQALFCWGSNAYGVLATGDFADVTTPPPVPMARGVSQIALGQSYLCILFAVNGGVRCVGTNYNGQAGNGDIGTYVLAIPTADVVTSIRWLSGGRNFVCALALDPDGSGVRCWGENSQGQCGISPVSQGNVLVPPASGAGIPTPSNSPTTSLTPTTSPSSSATATVTPTVSITPSQSPAVLVATGAAHTCMVSAFTGYGMRCWGNGTCGARCCFHASDLRQMTPIALTPL